MAKTLRSTLDALASFCQAHGLIDSATVGEPSFMQDGYAAAVMHVRSRSEITTLTQTVETRTVAVQISHLAPLDAPGDEGIEGDLGEIVDDLIEDFLGDFDLGGVIRAIEPVGIEVDWGYLTVKQQSYRIATITVPMTVDDRATFVQ